MEAALKPTAMTGTESTLFLSASASTSMVIREIAPLLPVAAIFFNALTSMLAAYLSKELEREGEGGRGRLFQRG